MCRRRLGTAGWAAVLLLACAAPATELSAVQGPVVTESDQALLARLESLRSRLEVATAEMEQARRLRSLEEAALVRPRVDTLTVGPLNIVVPPDQADLAAEIFAEVWREDFGYVAGSPSLASRYFTFQWVLRPQRIYMTPTEEGGAPFYRIEMFRMVDRTSEAMRRRVRAAISEALMDDFVPESPLRSWLRQPGIRDLEPQTAYRNLAMVAGLPGPHGPCFSGDAPACWAALALGFDGTLETLSAWYTPEERVAIASRDGGWGLRGSSLLTVNRLDRNDPAALACAETGDQAVCDALLMSAYGWRGIEPRGDAAERWTFFWEAIRLGGDGAWARALARAEAEPGEVLTYASGLDADELATAWHEAVIAAQPPLYADLGRTRWGVLFWTLVFATFAMRSTRWRFA